MYIIKRKEVVILDSNISDIDSNYTQFAQGNSYALNQYVQYGQDIFMSLIADNTATPIAETTDLNWSYKKKANKWACFDEKTLTKTTHESKITYVVESRYVDYIGIMGLKANKVRLELYGLNDDIATTTPIWEYEEDTFIRKSTNYTEYITKDGYYIDTFLADIFPYYNTKLKIIITGTDVEVGNIIYNKKIEVGIVLNNDSLSVDLGNLVDVSLDSETGQMVSIPILPQEDLSIPVLIETKDFTRVKNIFKEILGEYCLFVAVKKVNNKLPNIACFGFYTRLRVPIGLNNCEYDLVIKGVI